MAYAIRTADGLVPLTRFVSPELLLSAGSDTIIYEGERSVHREVAGRLFETVSTTHGPESAGESLRTYSAACRR